MTRIGIQTPERSFDSYYSWSKKGAINKPSDYPSEINANARGDPQAVRTIDTFKYADRERNDRTTTRFLESGLPVAIEKSTPLAAEPKEFDHE